MIRRARVRLPLVVYPVVLSLTILAVAPFMGLVRDALFRRFGDAVVTGLLVAMGAVGAAVFVAFLVALRGAAWWRWAGLGLAALGVWLQIAGLSTGLPRVDAVEKIHIVEYGLLSILLYRAVRRAEPGSGEPSARRGPGILLLPWLGVVLVGTLDELVQWYFQLRVGEFRDVLLNVAAGTNGLLAAVCAWPPERVRILATRRESGRILLATALVCLVLGVFVDRAHLGHEIHDPEVGRFFSFHSPDELRAAAAERARRWAVDPPTGLLAWEAEDLFLSEAARHVQHRNQRLGAGDFTMAWQANRILERWYDPFLDLESFLGSGRHRWWPNDRRSIETQAFEGAAPPAPAAYRSPVLEQRVWLLSHAQLWGLVVPLVLVLAAVGAWLDRR